MSSNAKKAKVDNGSDKIPEVDEPVATDQTEAEA